MMIEPRLQDAAARCVSILRRYHDGERTADARALMRAEVATLVGWLIEIDTPRGLAEGGVLEPVEEWLLARYGHEAGRSLNGEFVDAFEAAGAGLIFRAGPPRLAAGVSDPPGRAGGPAAGPVDRAALAARLRSVRERVYGVDGVEALARTLGLPPQTWLNYEAGVTIPGEILLRFLDLTRADPRWFVAGEGPISRAEPDEIPRRAAPG